MNLLYFVHYLYSVLEALVGAAITLVSYCSTATTPRGYSLLPFLFPMCPGSC